MNDNYFLAPELFEKKCCKQYVERYFAQKKSYDITEDLSGIFK
jgi:hypothetical protein